MNQESPRCEVWECRPADTYYASHNLIVIEDHGGEPGSEAAPLILDPELPGADRQAWESTSAVAVVLAVAGFGGRHYSRMRVVERDPNEITLVKLRGFSAPRDERARIADAVRRAMTGDTGGWWPLVLDTVGFNSCPSSFEAAWEAAGKPPVLLRHPRLDLPEGKGGAIDLATSRIDAVELEYKRHALQLPGAERP